MSGIMFSKSGTRAEGKSSRGQTPGTQKTLQRLCSILTSHWLVPSGCHRRDCSVPLDRKTCRLANRALESNWLWNTVSGLEKSLYPHSSLLSSLLLLRSARVYLLKQDSYCYSRVSLCCFSLFSRLASWQGKQLYSNLSGTAQHHTREKQ